MNDFCVKVPVYTLCLTFCRISDVCIVLTDMADTVQWWIRPCSCLSIFLGLGFDVSKGTREMLISTSGDILSVQPHCISLSSSRDQSSTTSTPDYFPAQWSDADTLLYNTQTHTQPHKRKQTNTCTPTNPKRQNPGAKNNSLE